MKNRNADFIFICRTGMWAEDFVRCIIALDGAGGSAPPKSELVAVPHKWQRLIFWNRPVSGIAPQVAVPRICQARRCVRQCFNLTEWIMLYMGLYRIVKKWLGNC